MSHRFARAVLQQPKAKKQLYFRPRERKWVQLALGIGAGSCLGVYIFKSELEKAASESPSLSDRPGIRDDGVVGSS